MDGYEPQCGFWEPNLGHPRKQQVSFTTERFLQPQKWFKVVEVL